MWQVNDLDPELVKQLRTVSATAIASGVISAARYVFYLQTQRRRSSWLSRCSSVVSVGLAGGVIGSAFAALLYSPDNPLRSFGVSTVMSALFDVTNWAATRQYLVALVRAFASIPLPPAGDGEAIGNSTDVSDRPRGPSSCSEPPDSGRANSPDEG